MGGDEGIFGSEGARSEVEVEVEGWVLVEPWGLDCPVMTGMVLPCVASL